LFSVDLNLSDVSFPSTPTRVYREPLSDVTNRASSSSDGIRHSPKRKKSSSIDVSTVSAYVFDERDRCIKEQQEQIIELMEEREQNCLLISRLNDRQRSYDDSVDELRSMASKLHARITLHINNKRRSLFGKKQFCSKRRPYQNHTNVDLGAAFQFAHLCRNQKYAAMKFNIAYSTFRRHYRQWLNLSKPFTYSIDETRGRDSKLTNDQQQKLCAEVSGMIMQKQFVNDFIVRRLIYNRHGVDVSPSFISSWKQRFRISSIHPSYSRQAAHNPHSEWIERQFLRDVLSAFNSINHDNIINADETFCRTFPHSLSKVYGFTNNGREGRQVTIDVDVKQGITCMTAVTAAGRCLTPYFVKRGTTTRCIKDIVAMGVSATFSENGWMNEDVAIKWIDDVIVPHLNGGKGCLIWDIFKAHMTPAVKEHLANCNIKVVYVPASMTWKRQPLDTHIFAVIKKKYQAHYYARVYVEKEPIKQIDTIHAYNHLMLNINKDQIVSAFKEAILMDAKRVPSIEEDPNPKPKEAMDVDSSQSDDPDELDDSITVSQYEDEPLDESEWDEIPVEMPAMRRPRQAHNVAYDAQIARIHQSTFTT
jgi:hypothetical protein